MMALWHQRELRRCDGHTFPGQLMNYKPRFCCSSSRTYGQFTTFSVFLSPLPMIYFILLQGVIPLPILNLLNLVELTLGKVCMGSERISSDNSSFIAHFNYVTKKLPLLFLSPIVWCKMFNDRTVLCEALFCSVS